MLEDIESLKRGESINKPIYNHTNGLIEPPEEVTPNHIMILEGLLPFHDDKILDLIDFSIYVDVADVIK